MFPSQENPAATASGAVPAQAGRQEIDRLAARVVRVEDEAARGVATARSVLWLASTAALLGFVATSLTWRLGSRAAVIDAGVRAATALMERSVAGAEAGFQRMDGSLASQARAVADLSATLAAVETAGRQTQAAVVSLERLAARDADTVGLQGRQLTELALEFAHFRRDTEARLAKHHDDLLASRGALLEALTTSIAGVEQVMLRQAEELRAQREDMNATALQMRSRQQRLLGEATEAIAAQLDGLRQIVACLREDTAAAAAQGQPVAAEASAATATAAPDPDGAAADAADDVAAAEPVAETALQSPPADAASALAAEPSGSVTE